MVVMITVTGAGVVAPVGQCRGRRGAERRRAGRVWGPRARGGICARGRERSFTYRSPVFSSAPHMSAEWPLEGTGLLICAVGTWGSLRGLAATMPRDAPHPHPRRCTWPSAGARRHEHFGEVDCVAPGAFPAVTAARQPGVCLLRPLRSREHLALMVPTSSQRAWPAGQWGPLQFRGRAQRPCWDRRLAPSPRGVISGMSRAASFFLFFYFFSSFIET